MATRKAGISTTPSVSAGTPGARIASIGTAHSRTLTAADIKRGGALPYRTVEVPELTKDGLPGILHYKPVPARTVIEFSKPAAEGDTTNQIEKVIDRLGSTLVNPDGSQMFSTEDLLDVPVDVLLAIFNAITGAMSGARGPEGNASSGAPSSALSTV